MSDERAGAAAAAAALAQPARTIDEVIARMRAISHSLPPRDGVGHFNRLYLAVTEAVQEGVRDMEFVAEPFISQLDVIFANRYFKALEDWDSGQQCSAAWRPLFQAREQGHHPIQFALCGMNAHIRFDLQVAVARALVERDAKPDLNSLQHTDFTNVNGVLRKVEPKVKKWFISRIVQDVDKAADDWADRLAMHSIADERAAAWQDGHALWRLRCHHDVEQLYIKTRSQLVELEGRAFLL